MIRTRGVSHVELTVPDLDRAIDFYGDVFGFEVVDRQPFGAVLQTPGAHGSLAVTVVVPERVRPTSFGLALVDPGDLDDALALVDASGGTVVARVEHPVGGASAVVADPAGHRISL